MAIIEQGSLPSPLNKSDQDYFIAVDEDQKYLPELRLTWQIPLLQKVKAAKHSGLNKSELMAFIEREGVQDFHWDWPQFVLDPTVQYEKRTFYLVSNLRVQGALHALFPKGSRIDTADQVVYVDRVAVAPWNRQSVGGDKELKGIGSTLIRRVCIFSESEGYKGCVGLHSLPQARKFYSVIGMKNFGHDPAYGSLEYFEFSPGAALSFVGEEVKL